MEVVTDPFKLLALQCAFCSEFSTHTQMIDLTLASGCDTSQVLHMGLIRLDDDTQSLDSLDLSACARRLNLWALRFCEARTSRLGVREQFYVPAGTFSTGINVGLERKDCKVESCSEERLFWMGTDGVWLHGSEVLAAGIGSSKTKFDNIKDKD